MKPLDHDLQRLLNAAARAPTADPPPPAFSLEARVLAHWRGGPAEDEFAPLTAVCRWAVICAGLMVVLSILWSSRENGSAATGAVALANYEINLHLPP